MQDFGFGVKLRNLCNLIIRDMTNNWHGRMYFFSCPLCKKTFAEL